VGEPEVITDRPGRRVVLLADTDALAVTETVYGPGERGPDPHVHHHHADVFVVIDGEIEVTAGDRLLTVPAGSFVLVPAGVVHSFRNAGPADTRFFNLHVPGCGFGDYLRGRNPDFDQHAASGGGRDASDVIVVRG
jgi:mannose-6-phosphate isomerase-like protein (cupin superfamily)